MFMDLTCQRRIGADKARCLGGKPDAIIGSNPFEQRCCQRRPPGRIIRRLLRRVVDGIEQAVGNSFCCRCDANRGLIRIATTQRRNLPPKQIAGRTIVPPKIGPITAQNSVSTGLEHGGQVYPVAFVAIQPGALNANCLPSAENCQDIGGDGWIGPVADHD